MEPALAVLTGQYEKITNCPSAVYGRGFLLDKTIRVLKNSVSVEPRFRNYMIGNDNQSYNPNLSNADFRRPGEQYFLPNSDGKVILYTYIRKNACSAFKKLMHDEAGGKGLVE